MRKLYLDNGNEQFKFADTTTEIRLNAFDDGRLASLTADAKARIKNDSGYLLDVSASVTNNQAVITSGQLAQLPAGNYLLELWDTIDGGTAIYPSDGFLRLQINENVTGLSGKLVSSITVDDFIQQFSDLSQQLKKEASAVGWSSEVAEKINNAIKGVGFTISSASDLVAPYDSLDTLPLNSVVTYGFGGVKENVKNAPADFATASGGTVMTYTTKDKGGAVQILISPTHQMFYRVCWGFPESWGDWVRNASFNDLESSIKGVGFTISSASDLVAPYDSLDTLPLNSVVTYGFGGVKENVKNAPADFATASGGTVMTYTTKDKGGAVQILISPSNQMFYRVCWGFPESWGNWVRNASFNDLDNLGVYKPAPSLAMFQKIGIVGDSYASGELAFDGNHIDNYEISWGQVLARKNGATAINFSSGGQTTSSWLASVYNHGLTLLNSSDPQDLYICALGINDRDKSGESYIGSESDIDSGTDTFYGNYGKIIKAIQSKAPKAKIVISTLASSDDLSQKYNSAIETISNHFGIALIKQSDDPFFNSDYYRNHMYGGHPTGPVYAEMANAIERLISQQMVDNVSYFETYKK